MSKLRLMSQNQWNCTKNFPKWEERGLDCSAEVRMKGHVKIFGELLPDVVGGQEVNKEMQQHFKFYCLEEGLPYTQIWGNFTPLFYRADKLELVDTEYILYPEHVSEYEGCFNDVKSKSCNLGVFRTKEDGKTFIFATTHLWWKSSNPESQNYQAGSDEVRAMQIKMAIDLIAKYQEKYGNFPAFLVGDMNTTISSEALRYALGKAGYVHAHDVAVEYANDNRGYNPCKPSGPGDAWQNRPYTVAIDHILCKDLPDGAIRRFDRYMTEEYLYLSDHAPVYVDVEL